MGSTDELRSHWTLDPEVAFLNHGSYGACPIPVLEAQARYRERMEREPVLFFQRAIEPLIDAARAELGGFVGADSADLVFVSNATTGVNAVLRSLALEPGDEVLVSNHGYNACCNVAKFVAERAGARTVVAEIPFPLAGPDEVVEAVLAAVTPKTRLALLDHVTSPTALVLPVERLAAELRERGVETMIDGAHAPGMLELDVASLGVAYYTGNCHKWMCAPKGAAFLWVRRDLHASVRPAVISHGANSVRTDRSRFQLEFDWTGTDDPTAVLAIPEAIRFLGALLPGGWPELRARNRALVREGRAILLGALGIEPPAPDEMLGALASVPLPDGGELERDRLFLDPLHVALFDEHRIEVPVMFWPAPPCRVLRISAQLYNEADEYRRLAGALCTLLERDAVG